MFFPVLNGEDARAKRAYEEQLKRRKKMEEDKTFARANFKEASRAQNQKVARSFYESSNGKQYQLTSSAKKGSKSYQWEKDNLHDMPKSAGKTYDAKFETFTKSMGLGKGESEAFRKYLDAKEKGALRLDYTNKMLNEGASKLTYNADPKDAKPIVPEKRSTLDRVFDTMLIGNYMSANVADNLINEKTGAKGIWQGIKDGAKAGNPFGKGYANGEKTYSQVLQNAGWNANVKGASIPIQGFAPNALKVSTGTTGFALDVLADPTTYMTFGVSALMKGSGKTGIATKKALEGVKNLHGIETSIKKPKQLYSAIFDKTIQTAQSKGRTVSQAVNSAEQAVDSAKQLMKGTMTDDVARSIVQNQASRTGKVLDEESLIRESQLLKDKYHSLLGTNRENVGIGIGLRNSILNPVINSTIGRKSELARKIANSHFELPGSKVALETIGNALPGRVYGKARNIIYGSKIGKALSTKHGIHALAKEDPSKLYDFVDMVQKTQGFHGDKIKEEQLIRDYAKQNLVNLSESDRTKLLEALQDKTILAPIKRMVGLKDMNEVQQLRQGLKVEQEEIQRKLDNLTNQRNLLEQVRTAHAQDLDGSKEALDLAEQDYFEALSELDLTKIRDKAQFDSAIAMLKQQADELEARYMNMETPLKPEEIKSDMEQPTPPKRPYTRNPKEPELEEVPDAPVKPEAPKREDFVSKEMEESSDLHQKAYDTIQRWKGVQGKKSAKDYVETTDELSALIYGKTGEISPSIYDYAVDNLIKMIENGSSPRFIQQYIDAKKMYYDGRAVDIYRHAGDVIGYGQGRKDGLTSWEKYYTERIRVLESRMQGKEGKLSDSDYDLYQKLTQDNLKRALLVSQLSMMNKQELKKYLDDYRIDQFNHVTRKNFDVKVQKGYENEGEALRGRFVDEDSALHETDSQGNVIRSRRTGEFDSKDSDYIGFKMNEVERDYARGLVVNHFIHKQWDNQKGVKELTSAQLRSIDAVVQEINPILVDFFKMPLMKLSPKQQKFLINMAEQHALTQTRGGTKMMEQVLKQEAQKRQEFYKELSHQEAVKAIAENNSPVVYRDGKGLRVTGRVIGVNHDIDGNIVYNIRNNKTGEVVKEVQPKDIIQVDKRKPVEIIFENTMERQIQKQLDDATKLYEAEVKKLDEEHELLKSSIDESNQEKMAKYKEEVAKVEQLRAEKKAKYEEDVAKYEEDMNTFYEKQADVDMLNQANLRDWEEAVRQSSRMADDYLTQKQTLLDDINVLKRDAGERMGQLDELRRINEEDFISYYDRSVENIAQLEKTISDLDNELASKEIPQDMVARLDELNHALASDEAFESFLELKYADNVKAWDKAYGNENVGKILLDTKADYSDTVKRLTRELRDRFKLIGADEVKAGKLTEEQFASWVDEYVPHIATNHGEKFFKEWKIEYNASTGELQKVPRAKGEKQPSVTQDLGYGEAFSPFGLSRTIKKLKMPDGTWVERPTIAQINEVMKPWLEGHNAFSDAISDIYVTRALKHSELMYDEKYMNEMMRTFGKEINGFTPDKGYHTVMNFGLFRHNLNEMAGLQTSLHIGDEVSRFAKEDIAPRAQGLQGEARDRFFEEEIERFVGQNFPPERMKEIRDEFHNQGYGMLGMNRESFRETATPMVQLKSDQHETLWRKYNEVLDSFRIKVEAQRAFANETGNAKALQRVMEQEARLDALRPLEIKQVHETVVNKANQARQLQNAKNQHKLVKLYDKFQHFMKLNQTTVMPSFHTRNAWSNMFQVWLATGNDFWDMKVHQQAFKTMQKDGSLDALKNLEPLVMKDSKDNTIGVMAWDEIFNLAQTHQVIDMGFFAKDIGANDASNGVIKALQDVKVPFSKDGKRVSLDPTDTANNLFYKTGSTVGNAVENQARLFQFASHLKRGMSPEQAKAMVDKFLFDYSDLTGFEQSVMKRIFPYYTWLRKNARLQISQVLEQPGKYRDVAKFMNGIEGGVPEEDKVESQYLSPFARDWKQTIFNYVGEDEEGNPITEPVLWNPNLPFMDLARLPLNPMDVDGNIMKMVPQMNPLIKGAIEQGTNKNFFFDDKIVEDEYYNPDSQQMEPATFGQALRKRSEYFAEQFAPYPAIRDVFKKQGLDKKLHIANQLTGQKFLSYDYKTSKDMIIQEYLGKNKKEKELWVDKQLKAMDNFLPKEKGNITRILDDYVGGKEMTKENTGKYFPFVSVMQKFGLDDAKSRQWVKSTLDFSVMGMSLDKTLLGSDFTEGRVVKVRDGDTVEVEINGKTVPVRMNLIDTPESVGITMPFGEEASNFTKDYLKDKDVRLVMSAEKDDYGRSVAYVYVDGIDYNKKLLEEGLASVRYANLSTNPYRLDEYQNTQKDASKYGQGLWQIEGYADPEKEGYNMRGAMKKYLKLMGGE